MEAVVRKTMTGPILTLRALNRATLARQLLLERVSRPAYEALERLVGVQAQVPNPPYIGLWTRLQGFRHEDLTRLMEEKAVVRATMMRSTLHLVTAEDYLWLRPVLQPALTRALHAFFGARAKELDVEECVAEARAFIQERPRTFTEIRATMTTLFPGVDPALMAYAVRTHLPLVQIPPGGTWGFTGSPAHMEASSWLEQPLADVQGNDGLKLLVLRYLAAFGPATVKDIQAWSGLLRLQGVVEALKGELRIFRDEQGNELFDLPDAPLPDEHVAAPPRLLPEFDNLILSHADRRRIVADKHRPLIFLSAGRVRATFLVDGFVAGTWKVEKDASAGMAGVVLKPFEPLADKVHAELVEEGERLMKFVEGGNMDR